MNSTPGSRKRPQLEGLRFQSLSGLIEAIKKKELAERKSFKNPTACMLPGFGYTSNPHETIREVTVTSLRDEHYAWAIKPTGTRGVECLTNLYATKAQLETYLTIRKDHTKIVTDAQGALEHWTPQR